MDKLSVLPEPLLYQIISLLPFEEAARTSVLAHRWRYVWRSSKNIKFDECYFVNPQDSNEKQQHDRMVFINFIQRWIGTYIEPFIDQFFLTFSKPQNYVSEIKSFIVFATKHNPKVLELDFSDISWAEDDINNINHKYFLKFGKDVGGEISDKLESLRLFSCKFKLLEFENFKVLKNLSLGWIKLNCCFTTLLHKCPLLESLSLKNCWGLNYISISSTTIKHLVLEKCLINFESGVYVDANNLKLFKYCGRFVPFEMEYLRNIVEVVLNFEPEFEYREEGDLFYNLLNQIACARILTISSYMLQVITSAEEPTFLQSSFGRLQHLTLKTALDEKEYYGITFFLNSCPLLESLSIHISPHRMFEEYNPPYALKEHPFLTKVHYLPVCECLRNTLKVVEVTGFRGKRKEIFVLKYLLKYSYALRTLSINVAKEKDLNGIDLEPSYLQRARLLLQLRRASPQVQVVIS